jgi:hypothetical protein
MPQFLDFPGENFAGTPNSDWDGLSFDLTGNPNQSAGSLTFTLMSDGTWNCPVPRFAGIESGSWFEPTTVGIGDSYEARFTPTGFNTDPNSATSNDAPDWESLGSGLSFVYGLSGDFVSDGGLLLVEVRDASTLSVVASGSFFMAIDLT